MVQTVLPTDGELGRMPVIVSMESFSHRVAGNKSSNGMTSQLRFDRDPDDIMLRRCRYLTSVGATVLLVRICQAVSS